MVTRIGGSRRKTRSSLKKHARTKGKVSLVKVLQEFKEGDKVLLDAEPAMQHGMYHMKYHSKQGLIFGKQGNCYKVLIQDGKQEKMMIVHPVHLRRV